jgi:hypothetical protein
MISRLLSLFVTLIGLAVVGCGGSSQSGKGDGDGSVDTGFVAEGPPAVGSVDAVAPTVPDDVDGGVPFEEDSYPPSVAGQIVQDLRDGKIDLKTAALYELLAQFSPGRLPVKYDAPTLFNNPPSVLTMLTAQAHLEEYGPVEKAAVQAMLASPEEEGWMVFPAGMPVLRAGSGAQSNCLAQFDVGDTGQKAKILGTEITSKYFAIHALAPTLGTVPRASENPDRIVKVLSSGFKAELDAIYERFRDELKMKEPTALPQVALHSGRVPVYVATCDGANDGFAMAPGFIFVTVEAAFEAADMRRFVIPHELFHIFEFAHTIANSEDGNPLGWPYEAFAVAIEDLTAPGLRRWSGRLEGSKLFPKGFLLPMNRSFQCPEEPLHSALGGPCQNRAAGSKKDRGDYSKFVLAKFLMRNRKLVPGDFWTGYAKAKGDPRGLVTPDDAAEFAFALIGDRKGKDPYFDPDDRAAFFTPGQQSCDVDTKLTRRYTTWLDGSQLVSGSKLLRAAPSDSFGRTDGEGLVRLDSAPLPIPPWGTHRLLIQIPKEAAFTDPKVSPLDFFFKYPTASNVGASAVLFDEQGAPGRTFSTFTKDYPVVASVYSGQTKSLFLRTPDDGPLPGFVLVNISNFGNAPLTYQGAVNFPSACDTACNKYYTDRINGMGCMSQWCYEDCAKSTDPGKCQKNVQECTDKTNPTIFNLATMEIDYFCTYACWPYKNLDAPVDVPCSKPECMICWDQSICNGACDTSKPAGFYSTSNWPQMECRHWLQQGLAKCP